MNANISYWIDQESDQEELTAVELGQCPGLKCLARECRVQGPPNKNHALVMRGDSRGQLDTPVRTRYSACNTPQDLSEGIK